MPPLPQVVLPPLTAVADVCLYGISMSMEVLLPPETAGAAAVGAEEELSGHDSEHPLPDGR